MKSEVTRKPVSWTAFDRFCWVVWKIIVVFHIIGFALAALALASALTRPAYGADLRPDAIDVNLASRHLNTSTEYNERNLGLGLVWDVSARTRTRVTAGYYENSYSRTSFYALAEKGLWQRSGVELGAFGGFAYYPDADRYGVANWRNVIPVAGLQATLGPLVVGVSPTSKDRLEGVLTFRIRGGF